MNWCLLVVFSNIICQIGETAQKNAINPMFVVIGGMLGILIFMLLFMFLIKLVNKIVQKNNKKIESDENQ